MPAIKLFKLVENAMFNLSRTALLAAAALLLVACNPNNGPAELTEKRIAAVAERIAPHGQVAMEGDAMTAPPAAAGGVARSGEEIYNSNCVACHSSGAMGAPKFGDAAAWAARVDAKGLETIYANAINGIGMMPAKGTCMSCSDDDIKATTDYMVENSQ